MSDDCCNDTGCSVDTGDSGTCTDTTTSADTTTSVQTVNLGHTIVSAVSGGIDNQQNVSLSSPISTENAGTQTTSDGNTSRTKDSKCSKASSLLPCIRIVVFILVVIVLLLMCKLKTTFACFVYAEAFETFLILSYFSFLLFSGFKTENN